jgi:hypothetical protein
MPAPLIWHSNTLCIIRGLIVHSKCFYLLSKCLMPLLSACTSQMLFQTQSSSLPNQQEVCALVAPSVMLSSVPSYLFREWYSARSNSPANPGYQDQRLAPDQMLLRTLVVALDAVPILPALPTTGPIVWLLPVRVPRIHSMPPDISLLPVQMLVMPDSFL